MKTLVFQTYDQMKCISVLVQRNQTRGGQRVHWQSRESQRVHWQYPFARMTISLEGQRVYWQLTVLRIMLKPVYIMWLIYKMKPVLFSHEWSDKQPTNSNINVYNLLFVVWCIIPLYTKVTNKKWYFYVTVLQT